MAIQIQLRQGTTTEHGTFTGALGEVTVDTDKKTVVVHDGTTVGGTPLARVSEVPSLVPQSTEAVAGKAKIATTAIAQAGTNDTDFLTPKKLRDAFDSPMLGLNQVFVDVTSSKIANTSYQNQTGKYLFVSITGSNEVGFQVSANGSVWHNLFMLGKSGVVKGGGLGIVPRGWFYRVGGAFTEWLEMKNV